MRFLMDLAPFELDYEVAVSPKVALPEIVLGITALVVAVAVVLIIKAIKKKK